VREYYARQIKTIQNHGISIHGAFIFGLPHDYFHSFKNHTGSQVADFCIRNRIGLQPSLMTDLPGSRCFEESQKAGTWLYGKKGTMAYLKALCLADVTETNRVPPPSLRGSALRTEYLAYEAIRKAGATQVALRNAVFMMMKSFRCPTARGRGSIRERLIDAVFSFASQLVVSLYREHGDKVMFSTPLVRGAIERLYDLEEDPETKRYFREYVTQFTQSKETNRVL
jgi:hypothetical protein